MQPKIAFIKLGSFSHINDSVLDILRSQFPNVQIDVIDIWDDITSKTDPVNMLMTVKDYGGDLLAGKKKLKKSVTRTPYLFHKVRKGIRKKLEGKNYLFTFQTQSLFDCSIPGTPHFLYTDHTHLVNLTYPGFTEKDLFSSEWRELEKEVYQNATINFTMSTHIQRSMIEQYDCKPEQVACVFAGNNVMPEGDKPTNPAQYRSKYILFVGVDWERKGGPALAKAFEKVVQAHPDAKLTVVGTSPELDHPNVNIVGRIPKTEVGSYYEKAAIFCLPTTLEPFGIVFCEALSYKLPIVATNIAAIPDFVSEGDNGFMVDVNDADTLADRLIYLLNDASICQEFGERGFELGKERYTWQNTGIRIRRHIEEALGVLS